MVVLLLALAARPLLADTVWDGVDWAGEGANLAVNHNGYLVVTPDGSDYYAGQHYGFASNTTSPAFQAVTDPWVAVTFIYPSFGESLPTRSGGLGTILEGTVSGPPNATLLGAANATLSHSGSPQFEADWFSGSTLQQGYQGLGALTPGLHTVEMGLASDGAVDYLLDGSLVFSTTEIDPQYFEGISLAAGRGPVTYTNFQTGDDFGGPPNLPEPSTLLLVGLGLPGVLFWRRRRKVG
jgi:hypothetical protein